MKKGSHHQNQDDSFKRQKLKPTNSIVTLNNNFVFDENDPPVGNDLGYIDLSLTDYTRSLVDKYCKKWKEFLVRQNRNNIRAIVHHKYAQYQRIWDRWISKLDARLLQSKKYKMAAGYGRLYWSKGQI